MCCNPSVMDVSFVLMDHTSSAVSTWCFYALRSFSPCSSLSSRLQSHQTFHRFLLEILDLVPLFTVSREKPLCKGLYMSLKAS